MSDPAVQAAQRTSAAYCRGEVPAEPECTNHEPGVDEIAEFAAREMAKPIRGIHGNLSALARGESAEYEAGMRQVLDAIAPLIFTTEERSRE